MAMTPDTDRRRNARRAARLFGFVAAGLIAGVAVIIAAARFDFFSAGFHVNFAMLLGAVGTIAVGVGLMALTFYSSRSGADDRVKSDPVDEPPP
jgi:hypothetical protein